jgi:hypothetical protein
VFKDSRSLPRMRNRRRRGWVVPPGDG